jgi:hypothetical protein
VRLGRLWAATGWLCVQLRGTTLWCGYFVCIYWPALGSSVVLLCGLAWAALGSYWSASCTASWYYFAARLLFAALCNSGVQLLGQRCVQLRGTALGSSVCSYWSTLCTASWCLFVLRLGRLCAAVLVLLGCAAWAALCTTMWCGLGQLCGSTCSSFSSGLSLQQSAAILWLGHSDCTTFAHQLWRVLGRLPVVVLSAAHGRDPGVKTPIQRCRWGSKYVSTSMQISTTYSNFFSLAILSSSFPQVFIQPESCS